MKIDNRIIKSGQVDWREFQFIQTNKFKVLGETEKQRLKNSILKNHFVESFKVWEDDDTIYCLDGFHRCLVLRELEKEGHELPDLFRADYIKCDSHDEAAKLVLIYSSIYAKIEIDSLNDFIEENNIEIDEIRDMVDIPDIDLLDISDIIIDDLSDKKLLDDGSDHIPEKSIIKKGEIFLLGDHRVMCGDSTDKATMKKLFAGEKASICFTSPPYNCGSLNLGDEDKKNKTGQKYVNNVDTQTPEEFLEFLKSSLNTALEFCDTAFYNLQMLSGNKVSIIEFMHHFAELYKDTIYWKKSNPAPSLKAGMVNSSVELILAFSNSNPTRNFESASFSQGTYYNVIEGPKNMGNKYHKIHKAAFPLYLPLNIIENFSKPGDIVADVFGGTGTSLMASNMLKRRCRIIDLEPIYCETTIIRWQEETGKFAVRSDGKNFNDLLSI